MSEFEKKLRGIKSEFCGSVKKNLNFWGKDQEKSQNSRKKLSEKRSEFCGIFWGKSKKRSWPCFSSEAKIMLLFNLKPKFF